jgi:hypothetical protein
VRGGRKTPRRTVCKVLSWRGLTVDVPQVNSNGETRRANLQQTGANGSQQRATDILFRNPRSHGSSESSPHPGSICPFQHHPFSQLPTRPVRLVVAPLLGTDPKPQTAPGNHAASRLHLPTFRPHHFPTHDWYPIPHSVIPHLDQPRPLISVFPHTIPYPTSWDLDHDNGLSSSFSVSLLASSPSAWPQTGPFHPYRPRRS